MEKINIAELLKDCPKGMELDCTMIDNVVFEKLDFISSHHPIIIRRTDSNKTIHLTKYGQYSDEEDYKCVIFPKGKTTWEGFQRPFKDGYIIFTRGGKYNWVSIFKQFSGGSCYTHVDLCMTNNDLFTGTSSCLCTIEEIDTQRLATEEEKGKLFQAIKDNGYKWNPETKTLEKLIEPKFKVGEWLTENHPNNYARFVQILEIVNVQGKKRYRISRDLHNDEDIVECRFIEDKWHHFNIHDAKDGDVLANDNGNIILVKESRDSSWGYRLSYHCAVLYNGTFESREFHVSPENFLPATKEQRELLFQKMKEAGYEWNPKTKTLKKFPKFKVGDKVKSIFNNTRYIITALTDTHYTLVEVENNFKYIEPIIEDKHWELASNKFDINTLVPFESKVLVRDSDREKWKSNFWGFYDDDHIMNYPYECCGASFAQCIPYEGNEHLLGTNNDCDKYFKIWE